MGTAALRIVLDTNILIASIGRRSPFRWIFDAVIEGRIVLCYSNEILYEYHEVLARQTSREVAENVVNFLTISPFPEKIDVYFNFDLITAGPADNKFVDCAIAANAVCIVSNDKDFQILRNIDFPQVQVLTLAEFSSAYRSQLSSDQ